jgi:carbon storage regulator
VSDCQCKIARIPISQQSLKSAAAFDVKEVEPMLVLSRKCGESVVVNGDIKLTIVKVSGSRVRLGIEAPSDVTVTRSELLRGAGAATTVPGDAVQSDAVLAVS